MPAGSPPRSVVLDCQARASRRDADAHLSQPKVEERVSVHRVRDQEGHAGADGGGLVQAVLEDVLAGQPHGAPVCKACTVTKVWSALSGGVSQAEEICEVGVVIVRVRSLTALLGHLSEVYPSSEENLLSAHMGYPSSTRPCAARNCTSCLSTLR